MSVARHVLDGALQVPLPDDPVARSKAFAEVAAAWSTMISSIDHLLPNGHAATLTGSTPRQPQPWYRIAMPEQLKPEPPEPEPKLSEPKPNGRQPKRRNVKRRKGKRA
jgi:hypothetical protein